MDTNLPTPMTARVYVNLPEGKLEVASKKKSIISQGHLTLADALHSTRLNFGLLQLKALGAEVGQNRWSNIWMWVKMEDLGDHRC